MGQGWSHLKGETYKWWVLYTVALGMFTVGLDASIVIVSYPALAKAFHAEPAVLVWVNIIYLLLSQSLMLTFAKIGDAKGRKMVYVAGFCCFSLGLLICALSQSIVHLIIGRAIQGIGAATVFTLTIAMAVAVFPGSERGKALGILTGARSVGLVAGPVFGGLILDLLGWRAVFATRLPLALLGLVMAFVIIEEQKGEDPHFRLDLKGSGCLFCWLSSLLLFFSFGGKWGFGAGPVLGLGIFSAVFFVLFLFAEKRCPQPVIDFHFFRKPRFSAAALSATLQGSTTIMVVFLLPFYLIEGLGRSAMVTGLLAAVMSAPQLIVAPLSGRLSDRFGSRIFVTLGMCVTCGALILLGRLGMQPGDLALATGFALVGAGIGIFQPANNSSIMGSVGRENLGTAAAIASTATQLGLSSGFAIAGAVYGSRHLFHTAALSKTGLVSSLVNRTAVINSFRDTLAVAVALSVAGILASLVRGSEGRG